MSFCQISSPYKFGNFNLECGWFSAERNAAPRYRGLHKLDERSKLNWIFNVWLHFTLENSMPQGKYDNRTL